MTLVTIRLPGQYTLSQLCRLFKGMHQGVEVIRAQCRTGQFAKIKEPPHAFAAFDTSVACANDSQWNAGAMEVRKDSRPSLCEIRALRIPAMRPDQPPTH